MSESVQTRPDWLSMLLAIVLIVRSHHLVLRLGVDAHHARVAVGDSSVIRVFVEKGLHILNIRCS